MKIDDKIAIEPAVLLAPMAGLTDFPFRTLVAEHGAGLVVSEMVASRELVEAKPSVRARAVLGDGRVPTSVQIAGREADWMARAARIAEAQGAPIIDINMGCPARKVTNGLSGSALMRNPDHALSLIEAVTGSVSVPVTLKMRLGWDDDSLNAPEIAARAVAAGVRMIVVHGRTRCQFYKGRADWAAIRRVVDAVPVPVVANGDIVDGASAEAALRASGAAGVMVGRGAIGRPWLLAEVADRLAGRAPGPRPRGAALADLARRHYAAQIAFYGPDVGVRTARKHLDGYLSEADDTGAALRPAIMRSRDPAEVDALLAMIGTAGSSRRTNRMAA